MKAAVRSKYGLPEVLSIKEIEKPIPKDDELLVRAYAAAVSRTDCHVLSGLPLFMRLFTGLFKPRLATTGTDFAGQIEAIGKNIKSFKVGDKVMGFEFWGLSSHAQYLTVKETAAAFIPANATFEQAAACVEGVFYALNVIVKMNPKAGQTALVFGATGAIGTAMVQFYKFYGTSVTAVCAGENADLIKSLGAEKVIDYKKNDFTQDTERYDFVFDAIGKSTFGKCKHLLKKNGIYATSGAPNLFLVFVTPLLGGKKFMFNPPTNLVGCLNFVKDLVEKGSFKPVIDRKYPLEQIADAFQYVSSGQKIGNVILTMDA